MFGLEKKLELQRLEVQSMLDKFSNENDKKFIDFHREITNKYFETLEKIFRLNKEISLINTLAGQVKDKDFADFKAAMMQPMLEARWSEKKKEDGKKIEASGERIISRRKTLHDEILNDEKRGFDVAKKRERLAELDWMLEAIKK